MQTVKDALALEARALPIFQMSAFVVQVRRDTEQLRWTLLKWARDHARRHAAFRTLALGAHRASSRLQTPAAAEKASGAPSMRGGLGSAVQRPASARLAGAAASAGLGCLGVEGPRRLVASYLGLACGRGRRTMRELAAHLKAIMDDGSSSEEDQGENGVAEKESEDFKDV